MGDKITITNIILFKGGLFRIELHNETKKENYCLFVNEKELEEKLKKAKEG